MYIFCYLNAEGRERSAGHEDVYCREGLRIVGRGALNPQFRLQLYLLLKELIIQLYFEFFELALCHGISFVHCVSQLY